jgi:hypothetical protein
MLVACCPCWNVCGGDRYVTLKGGAFYSTELPVKPGDKIFGNMTRIGPSSYFIGTCGQRLSVVDVATGVMTLSCADSVSTDTGKRTSLVQSNSRLVTQPWAYVTLEYVNDWNVSGVRLWVRLDAKLFSRCYGCEDCSTYPKLPSYFTEMSMELSGNGGPVTPVWQVSHALRSLSLNFPRRPVVIPGEPETR